MDLKNKIALVTGGAAGIGLACTKELIRNGIKHVTIADLSSSVGKELTKELNTEFGAGKVLFVPCDVTKPSEFEAAFTKTIKEFGGLDILINNAGLLTEPHWETMIDVNVTGVARGTLLGIQYMGMHKGGKGGVIVNVASIFGIDPVAWFPIYDATKFAVLGLTRSYGLPYHFEKTGVRVLVMCPGITDTKMCSEASRSVAVDYIEPERAVADIKKYPFQKPENVAQGVMHIIQVGRSGSVWISEGEDPAIEIFFPDRFALKASSKEQL